MLACEAMSDDFGLDEGIWHHGAIKLMRRNNSEIPRLVAHEGVAGNEKEAGGDMYLRIIFTRELTAVKASDAFGHLRERDFLVGVHPSAQLGEMDGHRGRRELGSLHSNHSRQPSIGQCLDGIRLTGNRKSPR